MRRDELLAFLMQEILERKERDKPLKVGVDGRCASGKSTLADELAPLLRKRGSHVLRPSMDGFHHSRERRYRQGEYSALHVVRVDCQLSAIDIDPNPQKYFIAQVISFMPSSS